jgi:hypothetical protein
MAASKLRHSGCDGPKASGFGGGGRAAAADRARFGPRDPAGLRRATLRRLRLRLPAAPVPRRGAPGDVGQPPARACSVDPGR